MKLTLAFLSLGAILAAQTPQAPNPTQRPAEPSNATTPIYRVTVVSRSTKAVNYRQRSGATPIDFRGTALMPDARGFATVQSQKGVIKIETSLSKLGPASQFGAEYLTYVLWAITPEGRAVNVGEILPEGGKAKLNATTDLQAFGMIVTAEPYFAVTQPSDVVVMENFVRHDTKGGVEEIDAKYELLQRGQYTLNIQPGQLAGNRRDSKTPLELAEARNAVQLARATGADRYASETFQKAVVGLGTAEAYLNRKAGNKAIATVAREVTQTAEDARIIAVKKIADEQLAAERQAAIDRETRAKADAEAESQRRATAEAAQRAEAEQRARAEQERNAARADAERTKQDAEAARLTAQAEADRLKRESDAQRAAAAADIDRATREKAEAEAARAAAMAERQAALAETENAKRATQEAEALRQKAESEKTELRAELLRQFNLILETRDTARGLIVNMSDVLFDTGKYTLLPGTREKLAKVTGVLLGHPGLRLEVEGHTDNVGGHEYNQKLSEHRAAAVRDYLIQQGISPGAVTTKGWAETQPVTSNATAAGRQRNRRVELVVSGEIIGTPIESAQTAH